MPARNELGRIGYVIGALLAILFVLSVAFMPDSLRQLAQRSDPPEAGAIGLDTALATAASSGPGRNDP